jgi:hypothetical protein
LAITKAVVAILVVLSPTGLVKPVTLLVALIVVNAPDEGVVAPILELFITEPFIVPFEYIAPEIFGPFKVEPVKVPPVIVGLFEGAAPEMSVTVNTTAPVLPATLVTGLELPPLAITKAVVAICVEFVPAAAVGAVGVPVRVGEEMGAK